MNAGKLAGAIVAGILFFFGTIFAFATNYWPTGLVVSAVFFVTAIVLIYFVAKRPATTIQRFETSGQMAAIALKCPTCSASVNASQIKIISGVPYAKCSYCGHTFEVAEEPKW